MCHHGWRADRSAVAYSPCTETNLIDVITVALILILAMILIGVGRGQLTWDKTIFLLLTAMIVVVLSFWLLGRM